MWKDWPYYLPNSSFRGRLIFLWTNEHRVSQKFRDIPKVGEAGLDHKEQVGNLGKLLSPELRRQVEPQSLREMATNSIQLLWEENIHILPLTRGQLSCRKEQGPLKSITQATVRSFHKRMSPWHWAPAQECHQEMLVAKESYFGQIRAMEPGTLSMRFQLALWLWNFLVAFRAGIYPFETAQKPCM